MTGFFKYALVGHDSIIVCDYNSPDVEISKSRSLAIKVLDQIDPSQARSTIEQGPFVIDTLCDPDKMVYLAITSKECLPRLRPQFLDDLKRKWKAKFGNRGPTLAANSQMASFGPNMELLFGTYNSARTMKLAKVKDHMQSAQDKSAQNLKLALERGEQLDIMATKADKIKDSAKAFHREASKVKSLMCFQKYKCILFIGVIVAILLFVIITFACGGFTYKNCK